MRAADTLCLWFISVDETPRLIDDNRQAILYWDSADIIKTAMSDEAARNAVMDDLPNFTNSKPILVGGQQVASS